MTWGRSIRLYLADGDHDGLIIATLANWTGVILMAGPSDFPKLLKREEAARSGVYVFFGPDPDEPDSAKAYIGESDGLDGRLMASSKDNAPFWEKVATVSASDASLTKAHVRYLEARLIEMATEARKVTLTNRPFNGQHPPLPEADRADMEYFLSQLEIVLPTLGIDIFKAPAVSQKTNVPRFCIKHKKGAEAQMEERAGQFVVIAGSTALKDQGYQSAEVMENKRRALLKNGKLVETDDGKLYRFTDDAPFKSPSGAAGAVLGRASNGWVEWKLKSDPSVTLADWQAREAGEPARGEEDGGT